MSRELAPSDKPIKAGMVPNPNISIAIAAWNDVGALAAAINAATIKPHGMSPSIRPIAYDFKNPLVFDALSNRPLIYLNGIPVVTLTAHGKILASLGNAVTKNIIPAIINSGAITRPLIGRNKKARFKMLESRIASTT